MAVDRVIAAPVFMAGLRRSEAAALKWLDVETRDEDGPLLAVRYGKTKPPTARLSTCVSSRATSPLWQDIYRSVVGGSVFVFSVNGRFRGEEGAKMIRFVCWNMGFKQASWPA